MDARRVHLKQDSILVYNSPRMIPIQWKTTIYVIGIINDEPINYPNLNLSNIKTFHVIFPYILLM